MQKGLTIALLVFAVMFNMILILSWIDHKEAYNRVRKERDELLKWKVEHLREDLGRILKENREYK